jgi:hypothetical protein
MKVQLAILPMVSITVNPVSNINATSAHENENGNEDQSTLSNTASLPSNQSTMPNTTPSLPSNETD